MLLIDVVSYFLILCGATEVANVKLLPEVSLGRLWHDGLHERWVEA